MKTKASPILVGCLGVIAIIVVVSMFRGGGNNSSRVSPSPGIGETMDVVKGSGFWPCGSSIEALDEMMKWVARRDDTEVKRAMAQTGSIGLTEGLRVKLLDVGFGKRKVRVLGLYADGELMTEDARTGHTCWVASEALTR